jgi:hypothetical protein
MPMFRARQLSGLLALIALLVAAAAYAQEEPVVRVQLDPKAFSRYYPRYSRIPAGQASAIPAAAQRVPGPDRDRSFVRVDLTGPTTPYDQARSDIIVFDKDMAKWRVAAAGFKNLDVDWVTNEVLKIELSPGAGNSLVLTELINVETGQVVYRAAIRYVSASQTQPPPGLRKR